VGLVIGAVVLQFLGWQGPFYTTIPMAVIVTILSLKFLPSLKPHVNAAKASVKKTLSRDDTKKDIQSAPSAVTGIRQLDIKGAITLTEGFK
jgi:MFS family permease